MNNDMDDLIRAVNRIASNLESFNAICTIVLGVAAAFVIGAMLALIGCAS